ncbi:MAG: hypothetical protein COV74_04735 [Candidatus Omnitrophica bacterium CG11_big_fil_rev_8_21_14_0_20_45_26]|uniref:HD-GYP domain-containing protein n=1 Tax=Candidatus Abzuiibacterium crystallinum TaxID=1974748 RepID=A0A2H0LQ59_9BACT|nr:MAG: hypothetical protein COV74_04735 [Candidatus Omnitrophica bacterium CG11_big_fil_rev_8_21_14_0_20_45_26]PIW64188.1 MAG: hypothetical protein COW12_07250 [Candidatus Omnitrophica bacterium CG12_big_fil_rev_8_21_14_0_65_45_16]
MTSQAYQEALWNAARTMVRVKNPRRLLKMITRFVVREVGLTHTSILVHDPTYNRYIFVDSKGNFKIPTSLVRLDHDHPLIDWFSRRNSKLRPKDDFLGYADLEQWINHANRDGVNGEYMSRLKRLREAMDTLKASICVPGSFKGELLGVLVLGEKINKQAFTDEEISFFQTLANDASMTIKTARLREDLLERNLELELKQKELKEKLHEIESLRFKEQMTYYQIVSSLAREVYAKDPYTSGHLAHVERLGLMTAEELGYDLQNQRRKDILTASLHLHDVGKIGIPDAILKKPGPLTDDEWKIMRQHPVKGAKILEPLTEFKEVAQIVLYHHERYDGKGYPSGLKGEEIPIESRIISVVDAYHAIVSTRCYRKGRSVEVAINELQKGADTQFDAKVVEAFVRALQNEEAKKKKVQLKAASVQLKH